MDSLGGVLLVPPDRGTILGRPASWKVRWVSLGKRVPISLKKEKEKDKDKDKDRDKDRQKDTPALPGRVNSHIDLKPLSKVFTDEFCLSVFKHKGDAEPIHEWPASCIADCSIDVISLRKQDSAQPTLILTLISDKERKRRSARSAGLISSKDSGATTVWFRASHDDTQPKLQQWAQAILAKKQPTSSDGPSSGLYSSPFAIRNRDAIDFTPAGSGGATSHLRNDLRGLQHKTSSVTYSGKDIPTVNSDSPSVRSRHSDVSSPSSLNNQHNSHTYTVGGQHYTTVLPSDAGPGGGSSGNNQGGAADGQTTAQGADGGDEIVYDEVSAPPAPGETILDRAFQLGHIPGAEQYIPGQENINSIARFDALMRELDEKRNKKQAAAAAAAAAAATTSATGTTSATTTTATLSTTTTADEADDQKTPPGTQAADDHSDGAEARDAEDREDSDSDDDRPYADEQEDDFYGRGPLISPSARKALDFIAGRSEGPAAAKDARPPSRPSLPRTHQSYLHTTSSSSSTDAQTLRPQSPKQTRPHTSHGRSRFNQAYRAYAHSNASSHPPVSSSILLVAASASSSTSASASASTSASAPIPPSSSSSSSAAASAGTGPPSASSGASAPSASVASRKAGDSARRASGEKRQSGSNSKRLSFSEFTRRFSSTSGLLLNQATAGGGGSRGLAEDEAPAPSPPATAAAPASTHPSTPTAIASSVTARPSGLNFLNGLGSGAGGVGVVGLVGGPGGGSTPLSPLPPLHPSSAAYLPYPRNRQAYREERESRKRAWRGSVGVIDEGQFM